MNRRTICRVLCILMCFVLAFSFAGCRRSPALENVVYTDNAEVDPDNQSKDNDENNTDSDDQISAKQKKENDRQMDQTENKAVKDEKEQDNPQDAEDLNFDEMGADDNAADASESEQQNDQTEDAGDEGTTDGSQEQANIEAGETDVPRQIVDAGGATVTLPTNVDKVCAVGDTAVYVEMLGGKNRLSATSVSVTANSLAQLVMGPEEIAATPALWQGTGSAEIGAAEFQQLITIHPEAVLVVGDENAFSDEQLQTLQSLQIPIVTLARYNTLPNIQTNINIIAEVLGDRSADGDGKKDAKEVAKQYLEWMDKLIKEVSDRDLLFSGSENRNFGMDSYKDYNEHAAESGKYTLLINGWDKEAYYSIRSGAGSAPYAAANGVAFTAAGYRNSPVSYYLSLAGVANASAMATYSKVSTTYYVSPFVGGAQRAMISATQTAKWDKEFNDAKLTIADNEHFIGDEGFETIIVNSELTKTAIENDALWKPYELTTDVNGFTGYGFIDSAGTLNTTNIHNPYQIAVNPAGFGSWLSGSPESPLEMIWALSVFQPESGITAETVKQYIREFYQNFYGVTVNDTAMTDILNGEN